MNKTKDSIGMTISKFLKETGLTQEELAEKLGVSRPVISAWRNGHNKPEANNILKLMSLAKELEKPLNFDESIKIKGNNTKFVREGNMIAEGRINYTAESTETKLLKMEVENLKKDIEIIRLRLEKIENK